MTASGQITRNVSGRCLAILTEMALGVVMLPFNVGHLGKAAYGLWMLTSSITAYFTVLDLGYGGALVKFVAQYRARSDARALNEILSTSFLIFAGLGTVAYLAAVGVAFSLDRLFHLLPGQAHDGRIILLLVSLNVSVGMAFSVFGGVINGFQRYDLNSVTAVITSIVTALVNVLMLEQGFGVVGLVAATTAVRLAAMFVYRANAYRVFPALTIQFALFRRERVRELTSFSVYMCLIDWARKLNYSMDAVIIGIFMNTAAVAAWSIGQRIAEVILRFTIQLSDVLFPTVVDNAVATRVLRLRAILLLGTRLSLAAVVPLAMASALMARPLIGAWLGPSFGDSIAVLQLLALTVVIRVGNATATTVLKGAGRHQFVAGVNLAAGVANVALSIALIRPLGLVGVALGTLIPLCAAAVFVMFPAACRHVGLSLTAALKEAIWPAAWPAIVMAGYILLLRDVGDGSLVAVAATMLSAVVVYGAVFVFVALSASQRQHFVSKISEVAAMIRPAAAPIPEQAA